MSELMRGIPFENIITWSLDEYKKMGSVFGIRKDKFYFNKSGKKQKIVLGDEISTIVGPAAGPNSQLAQNIVASYLSGARFMELKTVQKMDGKELQDCIARPCIYAEDECYNCEWSTELTVLMAYEEYIKAYFACIVLAKEFGISDSQDFAYNMSVGYDLEGIKLPKIDNYIENMKDASKTEIFNECKNFLKENISMFSKFTLEDLEKISPNICNSVTLSTLHGCPAEDIEKISYYLLTEKKVNAFIKCNPTLLGYEFARNMLDKMGYDYIAFDEHHFNNDLQYADAIAMFRRLLKVAENEGKAFGLKITNTFPVQVKKGELPSEEMYMAGRSLYLLSLSLASKLSTEFKGQLPMAYSGGADAFNIREIFETGVMPITVATTILKPGGYERFRQLAEETEDLMKDKYEGIDYEKLAKVVANIPNERRNHKLYREKAGNRKTDSELPLFDCYKAPCKDGGCPIEQQIPEYLKLVADKNYDKAIEDLKTALALTEEEKDLALLHRLLAANYIAQKEWQNAVDEATKAIDLHDEEPTSSLYKTKALVALEQWDEATEFLREAFRAFPEEERFHLYEADIALAKGDYPAAQTAYRAALDKDPFNEDACCGLGHIEELSGNLSQAIQLLQGYVEDGIVGKNILTYLIQLLDKSGRGGETTPYKAQLQEMDESEAQSKADFEYIHDTSVYGDIFGHL